MRKYRFSCDKNQYIIIYIIFKPICVLLSMGMCVLHVI